MTTPPSSKDGSAHKLAHYLSDKDGRFQIRGFTKPNLSLERLIWKDPGLIVYKPGYPPAGFQSVYTADELKHLGATRKSKLAGQALRLRQWNGDHEEMRTQLLAVSTDLHPIVRGCLWTKVPRFIGALDAEAKRIRREEPSASFTAATTEALPKECGLDPRSLNSAEK